MKRQDRIEQLQERKQMAKDLISFIEGKEQTAELKNLKTWLSQEILITELSITMTAQREGWSN